MFDDSFNQSKGFRITRNGNYHHLLIKMEDLNEQFPKAIQELLNLEKQIELKKANVGSKKNYSEAYQSVKTSIKIEADEINEIVASKYF